MGWARVDRWAFAIWCVWAAAQIGWYLLAPAVFLGWWGGTPLAPDELADLMPPLGLILEVPGWVILFKSLVGAPALMTLLLLLLGDLWRAVRSGHVRGGDSTPPPGPW